MEEEPPFEPNFSMGENACAEEIDGETELLNLDDEGYYGMDEVNTRILKALATTNTLDEAYRTLLDEYDVDASQLRRDINQLAQKIAKNGMIDILKLNLEILKRYSCKDYCTLGQVFILTILSKALLVLFGVKRSLKILAWLYPYKTGLNRGSKDSQKKRNSGSFKPYKIYK